MEFSDLILQDQECFASEEQCNVLCELLADREAVANLRKKWSNGDKSSEEKWDDVKREAANKQNKSVNGEDQVRVARSPSCS